MQIASARPRAPGAALAHTAGRSIEQAPGLLCAAAQMNRDDQANMVTEVVLPCAIDQAMEPSMSYHAATDLMFQRDSLALPDIEPGSVPHLVPVHELLTPRFVSRHTGYADFDAFARASGLNPLAFEDLDTSCGSRWDSFVRIASDYRDWVSMLGGARAEWVTRRLGIIVDG